GELTAIAQWEAQAPVVAEAAASEAAADQGLDHHSLRAWLVDWLAQRLNLPAADLQADRGFAELGLDSLASTELAFALEQRLGVPVPEPAAYDYPPLARLLAHCAPSAPAEAAEQGAQFHNRDDDAASTDLIAVVGLACRFPGAPDALAYERLLASGQAAVGPAPAGRPEGEGLPAGGYIEDIDRFD